MRVCCLFEKENKSCFFFNYFLNTYKLSFLLREKNTKSFKKTEEYVFKKTSLSSINRRILKEKKKYRNQRFTSFFFC